MWVKRLLQEQYSSKFVYGTLGVTAIGHNVWLCNLKESDVESSFITINSFWKDVMRAWCRFHYDAEKDDDQLIWFNSRIRVEGKPIMWSKPAKSGLLAVSDMFENGKFMCCELALEKYSLTVMQYNSLKCAIPKEILNTVSTQRVSRTDKKFAAYMSKEKHVKYVYQQLSDIPQNVMRNELK